MSLYDHCFVPSSFDYSTHVDIFKLNHNSLKEKIIFRKVNLSFLFIKSGYLMTTHSWRHTTVDFAVVKKKFSIQILLR